MNQRMIPGLVAALALGAQATAQELRWTQSSSGPSPWSYGNPVAIAGDVNGDGVDDVIVGDPYDTPDITNTGNGHVEVLSGADGSVIHAYDGAFLQGMGTGVAGAGDVDGDGRADFLIASKDAHPAVYSGIDGSLLFVIDAVGAQAGSAASAGDVNADGYPDVIVGEWSNSFPDGRAWVVSGAFMAGGIPPQILHVFDGQAAGFSGVMAVNGAGDVNGDGHDDLVVGHSGESGTVGPDTYRGLARVYSGLDGTLIRTHYGFGVEVTGFGGSVAGAGDLDGDGRHEVLVGARWDDTDGSNAGAAWVFDGETGQSMYAFFGGGDNAELGAGVDGAGDVNGDGVPDLLVGAPGSAKFRIYSGLNGSLLAEIAPPNGWRVGEGVAGGADFDGDGSADFAVGSPGLGSSRVYAYGGICTGANYGYCTAAPNSHSSEGGTITASGSTSISAGNLLLLARRCPPGQSGVFFYGTQQQEIPYGDGTLCVGGPFFRIFPVVTMDSQGIASLQLDFDAPPLGQGSGMIEAGDTRYFSFWFRDPMGGPVGFNYTDGRVLTFCP